MILLWEWLGSISDVGPSTMLHLIITVMMRCNIIVSCQGPTSGPLSFEFWHFPDYYDSLGFYAFLSRHGQHAGLQLRYPDARVYSNAIVPQVISVYKETFASALPRRAPTYFCERSKEETGEAASYSFQQRSEDVAIRGHICIPVQTAQACCLSAWATMKCADVYGRHCWAGSCIEATQFYESRVSIPDFHFWLAYGAWSNCPHCASIHWFDE